MFTLEMSPHPPEVAVSSPHVLALDRLLLLLCLLLGVGAGQRHGTWGWVSVSCHNHDQIGVLGTLSLVWIDSTGQALIELQTFV